MKSSVTSCVDFFEWWGGGSTSKEGKGELTSKLHVSMGIIFFHPPSVPKVIIRKEW